MRKPKIGLLPLYLELYDISLEFMRPRIDAFSQTIAAALAKRGLELVAAPVCRLRQEFADAVAVFEKQGVDILVSLHLAYSPSLESADILASANLPLVILDTTESYSFGPMDSPDEMLYNHGIHGVQDLCNLLVRKGRKFEIEAGHWLESDVLDRVASWARAAVIKTNLQKSKVGIVGNPFQGMGDFLVDEKELEQSIGIKTVHYDFNQRPQSDRNAAENEIAREIGSFREQFSAGSLSETVLKRVAAAGLMIREWVSQERLTAFTVNFLAVDKRSGIPAMPFLEASRAMSRGIGYAGEGDVLTAAFMGALASVYGDVTFTEMFCPDWKNNSICLSHMGEMNISLTAGKPRLREMDFPYTDAGSTVAACGRLRAGQAAIVNLAPVQGGRFSLIVAPGEMLGVEGEDRFMDMVHGWFRPSLPVSSFLAKYSLNGGTHHSVLVYGDYADEIARAGRLLDWQTIMI